MWLVLCLAIPDSLTVDLMVDLMVEFRLPPCPIQPSSTQYTVYDIPTIFQSVMKIKLHTTWKSIVQPHSTLKKSTTALFSSLFDTSTLHTSLFWLRRSRALPICSCVVGASVSSLSSMEIYFIRTCFKLYEVPSIGEPKAMASSPVSSSPVSMSSFSPVYAKLLSLSKCIIASIFFNYYLYYYCLQYLHSLRHSSSSFEQKNSSSISSISLLSSSQKTLAKSFRALATVLALQLAIDKTCGSLKLLGNRTKPRKTVAN